MRLNQQPANRLEPTGVDREAFAWPLGIKTEICRRWEMEQDS
ncbi:hypothetical protein RBSH_01950 [Rhodopirellula baltica SH28]|uniref:Uncharacterized protein n=1 Tax=Rhodopirellula baltica SH28 TaxID=993517 RepID=K5DJY0_RHOBT|nr:hypothetical protein RBSH_01950 [Rhodopirellula baltica SH28]